jgi:hypothetical protein
VRARPYDRNLRHFCFKAEHLAVHRAARDQVGLSNAGRSVYRFEVIYLINEVLNLL